MRRSWPLALALAGVSKVAAAEPSPRPFEAWAQRPFAADLSLALASPLGIAGLSLEYAPIRQLSLGAGVGTGLWGAQLAGLTRVRFYQTRHGAFFAGGGYSQGPYRQWETNRYGLLSVPQGFLSANGEQGNPPGRWWKTARWLNLELGVEQRQEGGLDARGFAGVEVLLNPSQNRVDDSPYDDRPPFDVVPVIFYFGAAFGYSL